MLLDSWLGFVVFEMKGHSAMDSLSVADFKELQAVLKDIDITVPLRGDALDKRTTGHVERWSMARFLASYGDDPLITYPLAGLRRDRPDYELALPNGKIGVEITEVVSQDLARIDAMRTREDDLFVIDTSLFKPGAPRKSTSELKAILEASRVRESDSEDIESCAGIERGACLMGPGWAGDSVEREWAQAMFEAITRKGESAKKVGFTAYPQMWILIYDNLSSPALNTGKAVANLQALLEPLWDLMPFSRIFIERSNEFIQVNRGVDSVRAIRNLWDT